MKKQLKRFGSILFLSGALLFLGCQTEELALEQQNYEQQKIEYKKVSFDQVQVKNSKILGFFDNALRKAKSSKLGHRGPNPDNSYAIDSTNVVFISYDDYSTYTFSVVPDSGANLLQNIVIADTPEGLYSYLSEYELKASVEEIGQKDIGEFIDHSVLYELDNTYSDEERNNLCFQIGHYETVNRCEGELVTPGDRPDCFNADGTPATDKVFIVSFSACSDGSAGGDGVGANPPSGPGTDYPGTSNPGNNTGGGGGTAPGTGNPNNGNPTDPNQNPGGPNPGNGGGKKPIITGPLYIPVPPRTVAYLYAHISAEQSAWLTAHPIAATAIHSFTAGDNYGTYSMNFVREILTVVVDYGQEFGNTAETSEIAEDFITSMLNEDVDTFDEAIPVLDVAPDCDSFQFINTGPNWQMSAVTNIHFVIVLIGPNGADVSHVVDYPRPILFGCPRNLAVGNTTITPGMAASLSARALNRAMSETSKKYANKRVSWTIVHLEFEKLLKKNYKDYVPGGRVDTHPQNYPANVIPTVYQSTAYGDNDCQ